MTKFGCQELTEILEGRSSIKPADVAAQIFQHAHKCEECAARLDAIDDPALVVELFGAASSDQSEVDQTLAAFEADKRKHLETTIRDVLLPSLGPALRQRVADVDPFVLNDAIQGTSLLMYREARRRPEADQRALLSSDGRLQIGSERYPDEEVAREIASSADLWGAHESHERPPKLAVRLAGWISDAARDQVLLLPHMRADSAQGKASETWFSMVRASTRTADPQARWTLGANLRKGAVTIIVAQSETSTRVYEVPAEHVSQKLTLRVGDLTVEYPVPDSWSKLRSSEGFVVRAFDAPRQQFHYALSKATGTPPSQLPAAASLHGPRDCGELRSVEVREGQMTIVGEAKQVTLRVTDHVMDANQVDAAYRAIKS